MIDVCRRDVETCYSDRPSGMVESHGIAKYTVIAQHESDASLVVSR